MRRKFSVTLIIFFSAFMLNVSAMAFQQRYDRREDDEDYDPFVIEMTHLQVFKQLKNTWFFDFPIERSAITYEQNFFNEENGFGNEHIITAKPFLSCHLKFVLIEYIGFYDRLKDPATYHFNESG